MQFSVYTVIGTLKKCFKGIVSRDFEWLLMILMDRLCVLDVPLEVYSFLNLHLHSFLIFKFTAG